MAAQNDQSRHKNHVYISIDGEMGADNGETEAFAFVRAMN